MQVNPPAHNPSSTGFMIRFSILLGLIIGGFYPAAKATTLAPKPPVLLKQNAQWWNQSNRPHPVQGWDTFTQSIKNYHPNIKQDLLEAALKAFYQIRALPGLKKKPSTSELIDWLKLLLAEEIPPEALYSQDEKIVVPPLHGALLKNEQDIHLFERLVMMNRNHR